MAEVFLAKAAGPMGFEKTLVLKRILPHLAEETSFVEMFLSEAKLAAQLTHPNIVQIFDFGEADGAYFLAMEYIDGPHLRALVKGARAQGRPLPPAICARIISLACEGLAFAHDFADPQTGEPMGLIHRDISPDNILMSRQGAVKVVDFGIAKAAGQSHRTQSGVIKGKLAYMPPEQIRAKTLDRRVDVYALGVVLYELLTTRKPFESTSDVGLMQAILFEQPVPAFQLRPELPESLLRILDRALTKEREQRYPDCLAFQSDLEDFILSVGKPVTTQQLAQLISQTTASTNTPVPLHDTPRGGKALPTTTPIHTPVPASIPGTNPSAWAEPPTLKTPRPQEPDAESLQPQAPPSISAPATRADAPQAKSFVAAPPATEPSHDVEAYEARLKTRRWIPPLLGGVLLAAASAILLSRTGEPSAAPPEAAPAVAEVLPHAVPAEPLPSQEESPPAPPPREPQAAAAPAPSQTPSLGDAPPAAPTPSPAEPSTVPAPVAREIPAPESKPLRSAQPPKTPPPSKGTRPPAAPKSLAKGSLEFRIRPYATVFIDGKKHGDTPMPPVELAAGRYIVKLVNPDLPKTVTKTVEVEPQKSTLLKINLLEE
ncbi:protein kinase domain-containing protein [Stigmatella aurantiaca]